MRLWFLLLTLLMMCGAAPLSADVAILLEEPYGWFGSFNPTGHAAIYLNHVCAASPTMLRRCEPDEEGVVISRYHALAGRDWIALPVVPFFYGVDRVQEVPAAPDRATIQALRDAWRRGHLASIAPDTPEGKAPPGDWYQLIGVAYDRATFGFQLETTAEEDDRLIWELNSRPNRKQFQLLLRNCADFAREVIDRYYPGAVKRSFLADGGITTPKQVAKSLVRYGRRHSDLELTSFVVPQEGNGPRSKAPRGVLESFVRSKKYVLPLAMFHPWVAGGMAAAYLTGGRFNPAHYAATLHPKEPDWVQQQTATAKTPRPHAKGAFQPIHL